MNWSCHGDVGVRDWLDLVGRLPVLICHGCRECIYVSRERAFSVQSQGFVLETGRLSQL